MKNIPILYEDDEILIINKESGLAVQGGEGIVNSVDTLLSEQQNQKIYLVHRLDKDTAGILVTAKTSKAAAFYSKLLSGSQIHKEYCAVCTGIPAKQQGQIQAVVMQKGIEKSALTTYRVIETASLNSEIDGLSFSRLSVKLGTGRMHQIRIHLAKSGFPIIGDDKYGNFSNNRTLKRLYQVNKLQLAAVKLTLPVQGKIKTFEIAPPEHMSSFCARIFLP